MAQATVEQLSKQQATSLQPANLLDHQQDMRRRAEEREKKQKLLRRCLNPVEAIRQEARKPRFDFQVRAKWSRQNTRGQHESREETHTVTAQNESEAWAMFCDKVGDHPGPHSCEEREIIKGKRAE